MDYQTHMHKLGPILAESICMSLTGKYLVKMHREMDE